MPRFPLLLAAALGLVSAAGFAPLGLWPLTLLAVAGLASLAFAAPSRRAALGIGYWFGVGHFTLGLNWIAGSFRFQESMPPWLGWIAVVLLAFYLAVYPAMAAGLAWRYGRGHALRFALLLAAAWIATEWLRATLFTGFAWNPLSVIWVGAPVPVAASAALTGTYALSGLTVLAAALAWAMVRAGRARERVGGLAALGAGSALVLAFTGLGLAGRTPLAETTGPRTPTLIRVVQPNIGQAEKHATESEAELFEKYAALSGKPGRRPRLLLWPEAAAPGFIETELWSRVRVASILGPQDILLTGADALVFNDKDKLIGAHNSVFAVTPEATLPFRYDKAHLVPYGEYLALRWLLEPLGATRLVPGTIDFLPGPGPRSFSVPGFPAVGIQICYEIVFSGKVVDPARRPAFLFNPSNDAWFGAWGPPQHLAQARLRAIEEGLPVVRATPTGISAVIDHQGRIKAALPLGRAGFLETELPLPGAPTLFSRAGNLLACALALLLSLAGIALGRKRG